MTKSAGHNRFVWDVRHSSSLTAPPGRYVARLTVAGDTMSTPLNVLIDPRLATEGMTVADLKEQFDHNLTSGSDQKIGRDAIARYAALKKELDAIKAELDRILGPIM